MSKKIKPKIRLTTSFNYWMVNQDVMAVKTISFKNVRSYIFVTNFFGLKIVHELKFVNQYT